MFDDIVTELAAIYDDSDSAKRVASDAGIPTQFVDADGKPIDIWRRLVALADSRGVLPNLLRIAVREYPNNIPLQRKYGYYLNQLPPNEGQLNVGQGRDLRKDSDVSLWQLQQDVTRLTAALKGTEWGDEGLLAVSRRIQTDIEAIEKSMSVLSVDVTALKKNWDWASKAVIILMVIVVIEGGALALSLSGVWGVTG